MGYPIRDSFQTGAPAGVVLWRFKEEQMSRSGCASTPAFGREEAPIGAAFTARLKPCPSGLWLGGRLGLGETDAGILRCAQNDKRKTEADSLRE